MKSMLSLYNDHFNVLNHEDFHFGISCFVYIRNVVQNNFSVYDLGGEKSEMPQISKHI